MSELFESGPNHQLVREAKRGILLVLATLIVCGYFLYQRMRSKLMFPDHVLKAPVARDIYSEDESAGPDSQTRLDQKRDHELRLAELRDRIHRKAGMDNRNENPTEPKRRDFQRTYQDSNFKPVRLETENIASTRHATDAQTKRIPVSSPGAASLAPVLPDRREATNPSRPSISDSASSRFPQAPEFNVEKMAPAVDTPSINKTDQPNPAPEVHPDLVIKKDSLASPNRFSPNPIVPNQLRPKTPVAEKTFPIPNDAKPLTTSTVFEDPLLTEARPSISKEDGGNPLTNRKIKTNTTPSTMTPYRSSEPGVQAATIPVNQKPTPIRLPLAPSIDDKRADHVREFTVSKERSLWDVAEKVYGDGRLFRALHAANQKTLGEAAELKSGFVLETPTLDHFCATCPDLLPRELRAKSSQSKPTATVEQVPEGRVYETGQGDTLFDIACQRLGQGSRYLEIIEMNQFRLPKDVTASTKLPRKLKLLLPK